MAEMIGPTLGQQYKEQELRAAQQPPGKRASYAGAAASLVDGPPRDVETVMERVRVLAARLEDYNADFCSIHNGLYGSAPTTDVPPPDANSLPGGVMGALSTALDRLECAVHTTGVFANSFRKLA